MLNLIQGKLVIANPANITPNSQRSNSEKVTLQHYVIARRREPTKQSKKVIRFGLLRRSKATPRNDASLLWIDSLSRKSGSMVGNDYSMVLLSSSLKQPIYVFENGKMLQSYGKSQGGKPITIGYNPTNQQYFSFSNKGSNNSGSIYDAISGSTQGKYSADILKGIACPITASSGAAPNPPPPLPKPPGGISGGLAAGGQPLYSFNAAGSGEIALPLELLGKPPPQIIVPPDIPASSKSAAESTGNIEQAHGTGTKKSIVFTPETIDYLNDILAIRNNITERNTHGTEDKVISQDKAQTTDINQAPNQEIIKREIYQTAIIGGAEAMNFDPTIESFIKENPRTAALLAATPYVIGAGVVGGAAAIGALAEAGTGAVEILGATATNAARTFSAIGTRLADGSKLLMNEVVPTGITNPGTIQATAAVIAENPLPWIVGTGAATAAACAANYSRLVSNEPDEQYYGTRKIPSSSESASTTQQPVKIWDVNKPPIISPYIEIDPNASKPKILSTPIAEDKSPTIIYTPDDRERLHELTKLPGFDPIATEFAKPAIESFPIDELHWQDLILESRMTDKVNKPDPAAEGRAHTVIKTGPDGKITNYGTYEVNPKNPTGLDLIKRVDLIGKAHTNKAGQKIPTPHVVGKGIPEGVRPATADEIPGGKSNEKN